MTARRLLIAVLVLFALGWHLAEKRRGARVFKSLPMENAITIVRGNGMRQIAVFEDPNCGPCKQLERGLQNIGDVTVHVFLTPILGNDSVTKAHDIWCSPDQGRVWHDWMVSGMAPDGGDECDAGVLQTNLDLARQYRCFTGTPMLMFADGTCFSGAPPWQYVEQRL